MVVVKGLYVSSMQWDEVCSPPPYIISEDARYVMGPSYVNTKYLPVPWKDFTESIEKLEVKLRYEDMMNQLTEIQHKEEE